MAEVAIPRTLFGDILRLIAELRPPPVINPQRKAFDFSCVRCKSWEKRPGIKQLLAEPKPAA
jgi:hypothetical protein